MVLSARFSGQVMIRGGGSVEHGRIAVLAAALLSLSACAIVGSHPAAKAADAREEVRLTEQAFAKSMADRDFEAFEGHLSTDAVFFSGTSVARGTKEVAASWEPLFRGPDPPFSWAPDHVEVLGSGNLALSTGPVTVGNKVVGRFNSIWRLEAPHTWRIVFDKGESVCGK